MIILLYIYLIGALLVAGATMGAMVNEVEDPPFNRLLFVLTMALIWPMLLLFIALIFIKEK